MALQTDNDIIKALKQGDMTALDQIFRSNYGYCVNYLLRKYNCTKVDAEDLFMDALLVLRREAINGKFSSKNIKGYLITVAKNIYLQSIRKEKNKATVSLDAVEYALGNELGVYDEDFDPILKREAVTMVAQEEEAQYLAYQNAWKQMGEQCQAVLKGFYIDRKKLKDLQKELGYSSYDSIKTIRRRCFNQLKKIATASLAAKE